MALSATNPSAVRTVAAIDVGSNAIRLLVAEIDAQGKVHLIEELERAVPLGRDSFSDGRIKRDTITLAIEVIRGYQRIMEPYRVERLRAVATSAVREAENQDAFIERVYMATGIPVEVVTGSQEHHLLLTAVRDAFGRQGTRLSDMSLIIELGSGTAELAVFRMGKVVFSGSYPIGTIRLRNHLGTAHRTPAATVALLKRYIVSPIDVIEHGSSLHKVRDFIAVGGEMRFAASQITGKTGADSVVRSIKRDVFVRFANSVNKMSSDEIATKYGLSYQDSETLGPALLTYAEILGRTQAKFVRVPAVSMRDGLVLDMVAEETGEGLDEIEQQIYSSARSLGQRYQYEEDHSDHVVELALELFDQLADEHGLGRHERRLMTVAAQIHDIGNFISARSHHKHSQYIIEYSDIFGLRAEDRRLVSCIARYHRRGLPKASHFPYNNLGRSDRARVSKLAAMLRVADALDCGHARKVRHIKVELGPSEMILHTGTKEELVLERLALRSKADFFEEVFGRKVVLQS
jgi:exopolyphosphatase/guanosine-5'-triphosphate,3'-diphosphate pyrophosphatase